MKLVIVILFTCLMQVSAGTFAQRITLSEKNASIEKVLRQIKSQTGFDILYASDILDQAKKVNIDVSGVPIAEVLVKIFETQPLNYEVKDNTIFITRRTPSFLERLVKRWATISVHGRIIDKEGKPIPGVSVRLKDKNKAASTNNKGEFNLENVDEDAVLVISSIGYTTKEINVAKELGDIVLELSNDELDEVVVVAYGKQKKTTLTGAISTINTKEIKQSPAANLAVTLAGRLPGLTAIQTNGEPGRDITQLFIRGQGTINAQSPIILVDGVERDLTYIDPNEVESISILKDASSTAIFGVRGANGVILVTTKRGTSEIPEINFSFEGGAQDLPRFITPVNSYEYATLRNLSFRNDNLAEPFTTEAVEKYQTGSDPKRYPNTNWKEILVKDYALQQRYNLNVSGKNKSTKYFVNAGFLNQGGQFKVEKGLPYDPNFKLDRYNFRSNIDIQLNPSLKAFLNVAGYLEKQNSPYGSLESTAMNPQSAAALIIQNLVRLPANIPGPTAPGGQVITAPGLLFPSYGLLNRSGYIQQTRSNVTATYGMEQKLDFITQGLSAQAIISFDSRATNNLYANKTYEKVTQVIDPNLKGSDGQDSVYYAKFNEDVNSPLRITGGKYYNTLSNVQAYLNYNRTFSNKHNLAALVLYQQQKRIVDEDLPYNLKGLATRLTYGYDNKYFAEFNAGYNGSEQFAKGNRFGFFPSFSAGWILSNEAFLKNNSLLTYLKIRGSYGKVGNDRIGSRRFLYLDDIQGTGGGYSGSLGTVQSQRIVINLLKNQAIQWEVSRKTNLALEVGLLNALNLNVDLFWEKRDNILRNRGTIPVLNGLPKSVLPPVNVGVVENKGYEIELNYRKALRSDFSILAKVNLNYASNVQLFADEPLLPADYSYRYRETGYRIGQPFGYIVERYFNDQADIDASPQQLVGGHVSRPGDFKYRDLNGDNVVNDRDMAPIGYAEIPEYSFGAAFNVTYKSFDISALFQGVANVSNYFAGQGSFGGENFVDWHLGSWTAERAASGEPISYPRLSTERSPNEILNTFFNMDASYIRLKNVEIGFVLPGKWSSKIGSSRIRLYANGLNLVTWDRLDNKNFDPELATSLDYPITRLYNFGVNVTF